MLGKSYVIEHCAAEYRKRRETELYRIFVTESLRLHGENKYITVKYADMIIPAAHVDNEKQIEQAEEIIDNLKKKFAKGG